MIYAIIEDKTTNNNTYAIMETYRNCSDMIKSTFPPDSMTAWIIDTSRPPHGKSYKAKKHFLLSKALNYKYMLSIYPHLRTYAANDNIADYFTKQAKRYGLTKELKRNGVI